MNCLHCGKKVGITFLRKESKFCCEEHRLQFLAQQEKIALARLIDTQVARPAVKPAPAPDPPVCPLVQPRLTSSPGPTAMQAGCGAFASPAAVAAPRLCQPVLGGAMPYAPASPAYPDRYASPPLAAISAAAPPRLYPSLPARPARPPATRSECRPAQAPARPLLAPSAIHRFHPAPPLPPQRLWITPAVVRPAFRAEPPHAPSLSRMAPAFAPRAGLPCPQPVLASARRVSPAPATCPPQAAIIGPSGLRPRRPRVRFDQDPPLAGPRHESVGPSTSPAGRSPVVPAPVAAPFSGARLLSSRGSVQAARQPAVAVRGTPALRPAPPPPPAWRHPVPAGLAPSWPAPRPRMGICLGALLAGARPRSLHVPPVRGARDPKRSAATPLPLDPRWCAPPAPPVCSRPAPVSAGAQHPLTCPIASLPGPKASVAVPALALSRGIPHGLPVNPAEPRRKPWRPVQPGEFLPFPGIGFRPLPRQPRRFAAAALGIVPGALGYPLMPRLRAASAPVSRPAGELLRLPGCPWAPLEVVAEPIPNLAPVVLPAESRRSVQGLKLRTGATLGAWGNLTGWRRLSQGAAARWRSVPVLPKWGAVASALLVAGFASIPEAGSAAAAASWWKAPPVIAQRAAIELNDDFRRGLAHWQGNGDWSRSWTFDRAGFLQTGPLALFRPSRTLTNYEFEFLGQIQRKGMGWVVRARDLNNYQALKLSIVGGGGVPEVALVRYPVVGGRQGKVTERRVPLDLRQDTVYNIITRVSGSDFTVTVQGQVADYWSEPAMAAGGVGLFSGKGEQARVRWVEVRHQNDTLGRLCALFAPPGQMGASQ